MLNRKNIKAYTKENEELLTNTIKSLYRKIDMNTIRKIINDYSIIKHPIIKIKEIIKYNSIIKIIGNLIIWSITNKYEGIKIKKYFEIKNKENEIEFSQPLISKKNSCTYNYSYNNKHNYFNELNNFNINDLKYISDLIILLLNTFYPKFSFTKKGIGKNNLYFIIKVINKSTSIIEYVIIYLRKYDNKLNFIIDSYINQDNMEKFLQNTIKENLGKNSISISSPSSPYPKPILFSSKSSSSS